MSDQREMKEDLLKENAFIDAQQLARSIDRKFTNADIPQYREAGIDLQLAAETYVERYDGSLSFMNSVKRYFNRRNTITQAQARAALNVMRDELLQGEVTEQEADLISLENDNRVRCLICDEAFYSYDELDEHKVTQHASQPSRQTPVSDHGDGEDVLEVNESKLGLDISNLPDGRYAAPDPSGKNDYIFLVVKRVRKTTQRDRRFQYGIRVTGDEIVVAGTIEVRIWSSDTKEWIGQQKPNDVYRGKYENELELIMMMPEPWAILFGRLLGYCGRCGKRLTDDISREIGLGLECEKKREYFRQPPKYTYIGSDRPDKEKTNPLDEKYLKGELRRWQDPPKITPPQVK